MHLEKLLNNFNIEYFEKLIAISLFLDFTSSITRLTVLKKLKQKHSYPNKEVNKRDRS